MSEIVFGPQAQGATAFAALFLHFLMLSLLSIGGAITTAPEMQRFVVVEHGWITDAQFTASVAIAQAAPGPNVLFVAVIGWNVGGLAGVLATMAGILLPSTTLALTASRWSAQRSRSLGVRAFVAGLAPVTLGLLVATGWVLTEPTRGHPGALVLVALTIVAMVKTPIAPLWLVAAGAVAGALGLA